MPDTDLHAAAIGRALEREDIRAFLILVGILEPLAENARQSILHSVEDQLLWPDKARRKK